MRKYIRHPTDIPIEFDVEGAIAGSRECLQDVSFGGLSFTSKIRIQPGSKIIITIRFVEPPFESMAMVKWCRKYGGHYEIGMAFCDHEDAYRARMVEQICHIEHYKREALLKEGRRLSGEQAAKEWIKRFASTFPQFVIKD